MVDDVAARHEDEQGGQVVADEEHVARVEDEVVDEVHQEVRNAVIEHGVMGIGVDRGEATVWVGENGAVGEEGGGGAVGQGDEAAGGFGAEFGGPFLEDDEVGDEVDD